MFEEIEKQKRYEPTALTIGVFDGVHLGHRHLIGILKERARRFGMMRGVITFDRHPHEVLRPGNPFLYLTPREQRLRMLKELEVDVFVLPFTRELSQLSPREFLSALVEFLNMRLLVMGTDFRLGRDRSGDLRVMGLLGEELGFDMEVVPFYRVGGEVVNSTAIRGAISEGDMEKAERFLGRPFTIWGRTVQGHGLGGVLGFPTANLSPPPNQILPPNGVYSGWVSLENRTLPAAIYIGNRPTFSGQERVIEAHILGEVGEIHGKEIALKITSRLREERKFSSPQELKEQIERDVLQVRKLLNV